MYIKGVNLSYEIYEKIFPLFFSCSSLNFILHGIRAYLLKLNPKFWIESLKSKFTIAENTSIVSHGAPSLIQTLQDNSPFPTEITLDDTNYPLWSQLMEIRIGVRNKSGFLTGTTPKSHVGDKALKFWVIDNNRVKSWLIDSVSPTLMQRFIYLQITKEIWDAVSKTLYDWSDKTQLFVLNWKSFTTR